MQSSPRGVEDDRTNQKITATGIFNSRTTYSAYFPGIGASRVMEGFVEIQWSLRFSLFSWQTRWQSLKTRALLVSQGLVLAPYYRSCVGITESDIHVLRDCAEASVVWKVCLPPHQV